MPENLKKMIGILLLVCSIGGISCVGALGPKVDEITGARNGQVKEVK